MNESVQSIRRDAELAQLCIDIAEGKDITASLSRIKEFVLSSEKFAFTALDNIMGELRKLYTNDQNRLFEEFAKCMNGLELNTKVDVNGLINALKFFSEVVGSRGDINARIAAFNTARATSYTGVWRVVELEMLRDMLMTIISWRGASEYPELTSSLIAELGKFSDEEIEQFGIYSIAFLRGTVG